MRDIIFRTYRDGDEFEISDLFNSAFRVHDIANIMTPEYWLWRFKQRPGFDSRGVRIAEYKGRIVGMTNISFRNLKWKGKRLPVNGLDDVCTRPEITGQGIAKKVLLEGCQFAESTGTAATFLDANPYYKARLLYLKVDFRDWSYGAEWRASVDPSSSDRFLAPQSITFRRLTRDSKEMSVFREMLNNILVDSLLGFTPYEMDYWQWMRTDTSIRKNHFIAAFEGEELVGGIGFVTQELWSKKGNFKNTTILECFVKEEMRNKCIGSALIQKVKELAKEEGSKMIAIRTGGNLNYMSLLKRHNFQKDHDCLTMIRPHGGKWNDVDWWPRQELAEKAWHFPWEQSGH